MGRWEILLKGFFYRVVEIRQGVILTIRTFIKAKTIYCKYSTSIKIKLTMTCMYKEYEAKIKMVQEQWLQLKMKFLLDYNMKIVI